MIRTIKSVEDQLTFSSRTRKVFPCSKQALFAIWLMSSGRHTSQTSAKQESTCSKICLSASFQSLTHTLTHIEVYRETERRKKRTLAHTLTIHTWQL